MRRFHALQVSVETQFINRDVQSYILSLYSVDKSRQIKDNHCDKPQSYLESFASHTTVSENNTSVIPQKGPLDWLYN